MTTPPRKPFRYQPRTQEQWMLRAYGPSMSGRFAAHFHCVPFDFVISICPDKRVTVPHLKTMFTRFIEDTLSALRAIHGREVGPNALAGIVGYETKPSPHLHICLACYVRVPASLLERVWRSIVGPNPTAVNIESYSLVDPEKSRGSAVAYCSKSLDDPTGEAGEVDVFGNINSFLPDARARRDAKRRRQWSPAALAIRARILGQKDTKVISPEQADNALNPKQTALNQSLFG